MKFGINNNKKN